MIHFLYFFSQNYIVIRNFADIHHLACWFHSIPNPQLPTWNPWSAKDGCAWQTCIKMLNVCMGYHPLLLSLYVISTQLSSAIQLSVLHISLWDMGTDITAHYLYKFTTLVCGHDLNWRLPYFHKQAAISIIYRVAAFLNLKPRAKHITRKPYQPQFKI